MKQWKEVCKALVYSMLCRILVNSQNNKMKEEHSRKLKKGIKKKYDLFFSFNFSVFATPTSCYINYICVQESRHVSCQKPLSDLNESSE